MIAKLQQKVFLFFKKNPDAIKYGKQITEDINLQASTILKPIAFIGIFGMLGFALDTDPKLHPEIPDIVYLRFLGAFLNLLSFIFSFITVYKKNHHIAVQIIFSYSMLVGGFITGRIADDANYVSGYQLLLMILAILPFPFRRIIILYTLGGLFFLLGVFIYNPILNTPEAKYSMNNLVIAFVFGMVLSYYIQNFRTNLFLNHLRMSELKKSQDGDYFLTTLLLNPFFINEPKSEKVLTSSYSKQKKKFEFKDKEHEIGGDINIIHKILLNEKPFILFVNADAMGKSTQGAGGVLVFGTAFEVIVERTQNALNSKNMSPGKWITETYKELNNVFEKFQGSMLMSMVLGLIDEENGRAYFINAEHPWPVLYRDGKASFVGQDHIHRKLGTASFDKNSEEIYIHNLNLAKGDILICGSDGRDDLLISLDENENRVINEDESLFLHCVERGNGNIETIVSEIQKNGDFFDDFSIIKIEYRG